MLNTNFMLKLKDGGEINNEYIIFFKNKLNNDIIYSNVTAESLQSAIDITKSYNCEISWIKGFRLRESNERVQFFYEAIKNYWSSNKFINTDLVDGQIIFTGYGNSVSFDFIAKFLKKENDIKVFDGGYLFNDNLYIKINPDFTFDDSKIIEYLIQYKKHEDIFKNGYYSFVKNIGIFADSYGGKMPKIDSLIIISYNSRGQNNLKVTDTINPVVLQKQIGELIEEEIGIPKIIISKHLLNAKRVNEDIFDIIKNNNVIIIDMDKVVYSNFH